MTSKEKLLGIIDITNQGNLYEEDTKMVVDAIKSALQDLDKLEEIRNTLKVEKEENINQNRYWLIGKKKPYYSYMITKEQYDKWNRWLDNEI